LQKNFILLKNAELFSHTVPHKKKGKTDNGFAFMIIVLK
jgi:hypothetical protein